MKKVGIIGGMGPGATIILYKKIIKIFQRRYNAKYDSDFPEMYICNLPIPDIVEKVKNLDTINNMICNSLKNLQNIGMDFIVIPCNTINIIYDRYKNSVSIPVFNIIEETVKNVKSKSYKKIALLATKTTYDFKLYEKECKKNDLNLLVPEDYEKVLINDIIMRILNGKILMKDKQEILKIINNLKEKGAEGVVLGCTDLPILINQKDINIKLFDTLNILAELIVNICRNKENLNKQAFFLKKKEPLGRKN